MNDTIKLDSVTVNAPDALILAQFYADITEGVATGTSRWAAATGPHACLTFQQVEDFRPPQWPGHGAPVHLHLEFFVDDLEATGRRVLPLGLRAWTSNRIVITASCMPTRQATPSVCRCGAVARSRPLQRSRH